MGWKEAVERRGGLWLRELGFSEECREGRGDVRSRSFAEGRGDGEAGLDAGLEVDGHV